ncbi:MAG: LPS export ABC transporter periplasmic protein LptC [Cytophagales bacterium]|nr:LPS export ABC transporter periplasmic protein LptC [Cytophagales bacterium]
MQKFRPAFNYITNLAPLISMSALALFSFALVKQANNTQQVSIRAISNNSEPDYYLDQFFISQYSETGSVKAYVEGGSALHFENTKQLSISNNFHFYFLNDLFRYEGVSNQALVDDDGNAIKLQGQAKVERSTLDAKPVITTFQSNYFYMTQRPDTISSNLPVIIRSGKNSISANSFVYEHTKQQTRMTGRVKIRIEAEK